MQGYRHLIPPNVLDARVFFKIFNKRNLMETILILAAIYILDKFLFSLTIIYLRVILDVILLIPALISVMGINDKSLFEFIYDYIRFKKRMKCLYYKLPVPYEIQEVEEDNTKD